VNHDEWVQQIDLELDGELSLPERAALARHLAGCRHCAEARVSHLELRVAFARSAGEPHARTVPRPRIRGRTLALWMTASLVAGAAAGWLGHGRVRATAASQAPNYRVTYHLRVVERAAGETRLLASAAVSGPPETDLRLGVGARTSELQGLLGTLPEPDTVNLVGLFFSRRQVGRSRRGLPLWEEDSYRRWSRVPWGGTALLYPFGPPGAGQRRVVWVEITVSRAFAAGETRASEEVTIIDSAVAFSAQAVIPPRRVTVRMWLVRGDTASSRQSVDLVPETTGRRVSFRLGREKLDFDVALERPAPPRQSPWTSSACGSSRRSRPRRPGSAAAGSTTSRAAWPWSAATR